MRNRARGVSHPSRISYQECNAVRQAMPTPWSCFVSDHIVVHIPPVVGGSAGSSWRCCVSPMESAKNEVGNNAVSLAGEYAVLSQLALRGYDAAMAVGKAKGVDILVSDPSSQRMYGLEVKTNYGKISEHRSKLFGNFVCSWIMGEKHEKIRDPLLFYCFVNIDADTKHFRFFIVPSEVVADYVRDTHAFWLARET
jgi:hypothetical protein